MSTAIITILVTVVMALVYAVMALWFELQELRANLQQQVAQLLEPLVMRLTSSEEEIQSVRNTYRERCRLMDEDQDRLDANIIDLREELQELRRRAELPHPEEPPRARRRRGQQSEESENYEPSEQESRRSRDEPEPHETASDSRTDTEVRRRFDETASRSRDDGDLDSYDNDEPSEGEDSEDRRRRYLQATISEVSDPSYWQSLHHFDEEESQEMEVDRSNMAMADEDGVSDVGAMIDDATVDDRPHDLELARQYEEFTARRSNELFCESNNLEVFMKRLAATEPYASGTPIEDVRIDELYAQHAPHHPLPKHNVFEERFWMDRLLDGQVHRYYFREIQTYNERDDSMTYAFASQAGLHAFRTRRIYLRYKQVERPGQWPDIGVVEGNLYRHYANF